MAIFTKIFSLCSFLIEVKDAKDLLVSFHLFNTGNAPHLKGSSRNVVSWIITVFI